MYTLLDMISGNIKHNTNEGKTTESFQKSLQDSISSYAWMVFIKGI